MQILRKITKKDFDSIMNMDKKEIIEKIKKSGLVGRSGSNFPTGVKWESAFNSPGHKVLICNADEGEPGTFKDRFIMEKNPELLLQGMKIGRYVLDAECFIYLRGEYYFLRKNLEKKIKEMKLDIKVVSGAGAYICGEETALMDSIEGKRGLPRAKPPYPTSSGLFGRPTCINNVETLANIPLLLSGKWDPNLRLFSVSGHVRKPGVYELPLGTKLSYVATIAEAESPKAVCLGYSGGIINYEKFKDLTVDDKSFKENNFFIGPGSLIFLNMEIAKIMKNISEFYVHESCGKCLPCREGGFRIMELISKIEGGNGTKKDMEELKDLAQYLETCFCLLGKSYGFMVCSAIDNFGEDFERALKRS